MENVKVDIKIFVYSNCYEYPKIAFFKKNLQS